MHSVQNSNTFLAYYNQIDKYLSHVLTLTTFVSYGEKIAKIADGKYAVSPFVRLYQNKLRYFGDLRNQLVHGFSMDEKHYVVASDYAVEQIQQVYLQLTKPKTVWSLFKRAVYTCTLHDPLKTVITTMRKELNTHVPVYDAAGVFVHMLSESTIAYRIADQIDAGGDIHSEDVVVGDIPLQNTNDLFVFVEEEKSIYEIDALFTHHMEQKKRLGAVFITKTGRVEEPIEWIITAMDLPKVEDTLIL